MLRIGLRSNSGGSFTDLRDVGLLLPFGVAVMSAVTLAVAHIQGTPPISVTIEAFQAAHFYEEEYWGEVGVNPLRIHEQTQS